jgi:lysophospholipase L1-like esterase
MSDDRVTVACLGSSTTAAKGSFDWIGELARRAQNRGIRFHNFGVGGDLAYNALQRLPAVIACRPNKVIVWIGGNDVLALVSPRLRRFYSFWKRLPRRPSPAWYRENLKSIAARLKRETEAVVGFCSLPRIGEAPVASHPLQQELNRRIDEYSAIVREVAEEEHVGYIPLHEAMLAAVTALPGRELTAVRLRAFYRDALRHFLLGWSFDRIAEVNSWRFHTDGIHLNTRGGLIAADAVQRFIASEIFGGA